MNIFVTSPFPAESAVCLPDKHIVKMPLEVAQLLCTAIWIDKHLGFIPRALEKDERDHLNALKKEIKHLPPEERPLTPYLPMMYMPDAIKATIELMEAPKEKIKIRTSYNISGMSFSPKEIAAEIKKYIPDFSVSYHPDYRQEIADSWPQSIDDSVARTDWGWKEEYNLEAMVKDMLLNV